MAAAADGKSYLVAVHESPGSGSVEPPFAPEARNIPGPCALAFHARREGWRDLADRVAMAIPPPILAAVSQPAGGRVLLVIGAGCSYEHPTSIPMAQECARDAHAELVRDLVLAAGDCADPSDLSGVADAVWMKTGRQGPLVEHLPLSKFRHSDPNEGYLVAAALLRERAVKDVVTLNYDLTISHGLAAVSSTSQVEELAGPQDHHRLSVANVIYLHRNVTCNPEEWVMRTVVLQQGWQDGWEQMIAHAVLVTPVTVFIGLGSPAAVLIDSVQRVRSALQAGVDCYQVDPAPYGGSTFTAAVGIEQDHYIQMGWSEFMTQLGQRVLDEHLAAIVRSGQGLAEREHLTQEAIGDDCARLRSAGLVRLGRLRAAWFLDDHSYVTAHHTGHEWTADILLGIALIERVLGATARFLENGLVEFDRGSVLVASVLVGHGTGRYRWPSLQTRTRIEMARRLRVDAAPRSVLLLGYVGAPTATSLPESLVGDVDADDVILGPSTVRFYDVDGLRANEQMARELAS